MRQSECGGRERVAIIGFSGRFPGARDVGEFWENLKRGHESLRAVVPTAATSRKGSDSCGEPTVVRQVMALDDVELFDAAFFGYSNAQACRIDPQQRMFLEVVWHALEHAGYDVQRYEGVVGIFAGASRSTQAPAGEKDRADIQAAIDHGLGSIANRVSYKLNLDGPSLSIDTACSTSLIAVHLASQSLLARECDMALAGGASVRLPQNGYIYHKNGILSPDGHCRAFDSNARGTVPGNGVAAVVMKRLTDAIADRDRVYAVILGSAINNDGGHKVGYTAPSLRAQVSVVRTAVERAAVSAGSIGLIEGHGTGTVVGDEIELAALTEVMESDSSGGRPKCVLGSVKANIGHLDVAAGVSGLIKATLCVSEKVLVPAINCETPNARLREPASPFCVNSQLKTWQFAGCARRAGVSSFGIGGSNAHVVLEEFESPTRPMRGAEGALVFPLSARTAGALERARTALRERLVGTSDLAPEDIAFTLQMGRARFAHRFCAVASTREQLLQAMASDLGTPNEAEIDVTGDKCLVLHFDGDVREFQSLERLYSSEPTFASLADGCMAEVSQWSPMTLDDLLKGRAEPVTVRELRERQLAMLLREYCLAQLWLEYGVEPSGVIGLGAGKIAAACVAGMLSLEAASRPFIDAIRLDDGAPLTRAVAQGDLARVLDRAPIGVSVWSAEPPGTAVIAGSAEQVMALCATLENQGVAHSLRSVRCHARIGELRDPLAERLGASALCPPTIPYLATVEGRPVAYREEDLASYWRLECGLTGDLPCSQRLEPADVALVVEPRAAHEVEWPVAASRVCGSLLEAGQVLDRNALLDVLASLWRQGAPIDWNGPRLSPDGRRVALPGYPFERTQHRVDLVGASEPKPASRSRRRVAPSPVGPTADPAETPGALASRGRIEGDGTRTVDRVAETTSSGGTELESAVAQVWAELLELPKIELEDRFLDIGGDSLVGIRVAEHLESLFGVELPLDELLRSNTTVRTLARLISDRLMSDGGGPSMPTEANGSLPDRL